MDGPDPGGQQRRDQPLRGAAGVAQKGCGSYLLERPSGVVVGLKDLQTAMAEAQQTSGEDYSGDWGERHDEELDAQQTSGETTAATGASAMTKN